jgi:hypothetical protein
MGRHVPPRHPRVVAGTLVAAIACWVVALLAPPASAAPIRVNCDAGGNLQAKIDHAPGGSTILAKGTCKGPFTITSKGLTIRGNPKATLDGQHLGSALTITDDGKTVTLIDLTVTGGSTDGKGGGIAMSGGELHLVRTTVKENSAFGNDYSYGGGIWIEGSGALTLVDSRVTANRALTEPGSGFAYAYGGGIYAGVPLTLTGSTVGGNVARAESNDMFAYSYGGGIDAGSVDIHGSAVTNNASRAVAHGQFAYAYGGGVEAGTLVARDSSVAGNRAVSVSDSDFAQAYGGGADLENGFEVFTTSTFSGNRADANGGDYATSQGGGTYSLGILTLDRSTFAGNTSIAAGGASFGDAYGGGLVHDNGDLILKRSTVSGNSASGSSASDAAQGVGGGIAAYQGLKLTNSTVAGNSVSGAAAPGSGKTGSGVGGGIEAKDTTFTASTIASNTTSATGDVVETRGGGIAGVLLATGASIIAGNHAATGPDCNITTTTTNGYNLVLHPSTCLPTPAGTDITGQLARLGALHDNGGPTHTMAISASSPAFNAIPQAKCAAPFDQRGRHRPQGPRCDIGAYERAVP